MTAIKRLNRKYRKHKRKMTENDIHRLQREMAEALLNYTQELIEKVD